MFDGPSIDCDFIIIIFVMLLILKLAGSARRNLRTRRKKEGVESSQFVGHSVLVAYSLSLPPSCRYIRESGHRAK